MATKSLKNKTDLSSLAYALGKQVIDAKNNKLLKAFKNKYVVKRIKKTNKKFVQYLSPNKSYFDAYGTFGKFSSNEAEQILKDLEASGNTHWQYKMEKVALKHIQ